MMPLSETFFSRLGGWKSRLVAFLQGVEDVAIKLSIVFDSNTEEIIQWQPQINP
ncbi:hypothetical protein [Microcoleus sp. Pol10D4]|uniref:hypothetical protein n=1 Tax=Microcoleus sp. Pol10D4 TaxID=3055387 RepID=UPI002FCFCAFB